MSDLEEYKKYLFQMDSLQKQGVDYVISPEMDLILNNLDLYCKDFTEAEWEEARKYSVALKLLWTPLENFRNSDRVLKSLLESPLQNETRKNQIKAWTQIRENHYKLLSEEDRVKFAEESRIIE